MTGRTKREIIAWAIFLALAGAVAVVLIACPFMVVPRTPKAPVFPTLRIGRTADQISVRTTATVTVHLARVEYDEKGNAKFSIAQHWTKNARYGAPAVFRDLPQGKYRLVAWWGKDLVCDCEFEMPPPELRRQPFAGKKNEIEIRGKFRK